MKLLTTLATITLALTTAGVAHAGHPNLAANEYLFAGQQLVANGSYYSVTFQSDGNLVVYSRSHAPVWASNTVGSGAAYAVMQSDGNVVLYRWDGAAVWATGTNGNPGAYLAMQSDGNLVVYRGSTPLWASNTADEPLGTTSPQVASVTSVEANANRAGGDFAYYDLSQPKVLWCAYFCSQDSRCTAYTYVPPGVQARNARCWLKSSVPARTYASGMVSGVIYH